MHSKIPTIKVCGPQFQQSPVPLYFQLTTYMRRNIETGRWPAGSRLPSLAEMAAVFGMARLTVRQAVQQLISEHLLTSSRGRGTFVTERVPPRPWYVLNTSWSDLTDQAENTSVRMLDEGDTTELPQIEPARLMPAGYRRLRRVHLRDGKPYAVCELYLAQDIFEQAPELFRTSPVLPTLRRLKIIPANAHQEITLGTADTENATLLDLPLSAPVAHVLRMACDISKNVFYLGTFIYRGDNLRLSIDLTP